MPRTAVPDAAGSVQSPDPCAGEGRSGPPGTSDAAGRRAEPLLVLPALLLPLLLLLLLLLGSGGSGCAGQTSINGAQSGAHLDGGTCASGTTGCAGRCANLRTDPLNCGKCDAVCAAGSSCVAGLCQAAAGCSGGQTRCGNQCTDLNTDGANCGGCGTACGADQVCQLGLCSGGSGNCGRGEQRCGGACTAVATDASNCGACGVACAMGQSCVGGACRAGGGGTAGCADTVTCLNGCAQGDAQCEQGCVAAASANAQALLNAVLGCLDQACPSTGGGVCDPQAKNYSAAACQQCASQAQRQGGKCVASLQACLADKGGGGGGCPNGQTSCGGQCTSTATDPNNCGACGVACAQNQQCKAGMCGGGGGGGAGCGPTVTCLNACMNQQCEQGCLGQASKMAIQLLNALLSCLEQVCPSKNGGVCDTNAKNYSAAACDACYQKAQDQGGKCAPQLAACEANR